LSAAGADPEWNDGNQPVFQHANGIAGNRGEHCRIRDAHAKALIETMKSGQTSGRLQIIGSIWS
jgi:hypothetical protein